MFENPPDIVNVVRKREWLLRLIQEEGGSRKELVQYANRSRSTVYRGVDELDRAGLINDSDGAWEITPAGMLIFQEYQRLVKVLHALNRILHGNHYLPIELLSSALLYDADIHVASRQAPRSAESQLNAIFSANTITRVCTPIPHNSLSDMLQQSSTGEPTEIIIEEGTRDGEVDETISRLSESSNHSFYETSMELPFLYYEGLDEEGEWFVGTYVYNVCNEVVIMSQAPAANVWAEQFYQTVKGNAVAILPSVTH